MTTTIWICLVDAPEPGRKHIRVWTSNAYRAEAFRKEGLEMQEFSAVAQEAGNCGEVVGWQARDKVRGGEWLHVPSNRGNPDFEYRPLYTRAPDTDCEMAFIEACDEAGCAYDNEALLQAIHDLKASAVPSADRS